MIIRKYNHKDINKVINVWYESSIVSHSFLSNDILEKQKKDIDKYLRDSETWVAEIDMEIVGFISLMGKYIGGLFVSPKYFRNKIGTTLLQEAIKEKGSLSVSVYEKNLIARKFYERKGFIFVNKFYQKESNEYIINMVYNKI